MDRLLPGAGLLGSLRRLLSRTPKTRLTGCAPVTPLLPFHTPCRVEGVADGIDRRVREVARCGPAIVACQRALGYGQFFDYEVQERVRAGELKPVLEPHWPAPTPIHSVYPQARLLSGNVRSVVDFVVPRLPSRIAALRG